MVFPCQKQFRHRMAKAVDALLYVADDEQIAFVLRQRLEDRVLRLVRVLVLVHHDVVEACGHLSGDRRPLHRHGVDQQIDRPVLEVGIVGKAAFLFERRVVLAEERHGAEDLLCQLPEQFDVVQAHGLALGIDAPELVHRLAKDAARRGRRNLQRVVRAAARGAEAPADKGAERLADRVPALCVRRGSQPLQESDIARIQRGVGRHELFIGRHTGKSPVVQALHIGDGVRGVAADDPAPHRGRRVGKVGIIAQLFFHPALGEGMRTDKVIERQDMILQPRVVLCRSEGLHDAVKAAVPLGIHHVEGQAHGVGRKHAQLAVVADAEVAVDIQQIKVLPREGRAEGIHRRDMRLGHQALLTQQIGVVRLRAHQRGDRLRQAFAQLCGRGAGIGHHQQAVGVHAKRGVGIGQEADAPLHQHGGLARSGGGRDDHRAAAGGDGVQLVFSPLPAHPRSPPPSAHGKFRPCSAFPRRGRDRPRRADRRRCSGSTDSRRTRP